MRQSVGRVVKLVRTKQAVTATLAGIAAVAGSFAVAGFTAAFTFTPVSSFVVHNTPAIIINTTLEMFGAYGQLINMTFTLFVTIGLFITAAAIAPELAAGLVPDKFAGGRALVTGLFIWVVAVALTGAPLVSLGAALPAAVVVLLTDRPWQDELSLKENQRWPDRDRRQVLETSLGVVSFAGASYIAGSYRTPTADLPLLDEVSGAGFSEPEMLLDEAADKSFSLPNSPDLVSEIGEFYTIDIATVTPQIAADNWELDVTGEVETSLTISYDELVDMEAEHRFSTLRCVGEDLNEREMDNAVWTGVPASHFSEQAGATGDYVAMHADDGFWNVITREAFEQSFIIYGMNGHVLPREHGHPVRAIVPGHWGEVNVKWLQEIEFIDENIDGYWEERGWDGTGEVSAVAKLWTVDETDDGVLLGGQAYDGHDGVQAVEVSLDGGDTWFETAITEPLSVGDAWRQWQYEITEPGEHEVVVRMIDGNGNLQEGEETGSSPDGATGWVSETITVS